MVIDYSERRTVNKNRPRKQTAGVFFSAFLVTAGISFSVGVGTGWLLFHPKQKAGSESPAGQAAQNRKADAAVPPAQAPPAAGSVGKAAEPSLTFYETLPKGSNALLGSGLNQFKPAEHQAAKSAQQVKPAVTAKPAPPAEAAAPHKENAKPEAKAPETAPAKEKTAKEGEGKGKYLVQVASYRAKKEAEEARDRLKANGMAAYVVEHKDPEKGTYYRVRIGKHLDQETAHETADRAGKGSIVIPE